MHPSRSMCQPNYLKCKQDANKCKWSHKHQRAKVCSQTKTHTFAPMATSPGGSCLNCSAKSMQLIAWGWRAAWVCSSFKQAIHLSVRVTVLAVFSPFSRSSLAGGYMCGWEPASPLAGFTPSDWFWGACWRHLRPVKSASKSLSRKLNQRRVKELWR